MVNPNLIKPFMINVNGKSYAYTVKNVVHDSIVAEYVEKDVQSTLAGFNLEENQDPDEILFKLDTDERIQEHLRDQILAMAEFINRTSCTNVGLRKLRRVLQKDFINLEVAHQYNFVGQPYFVFLYQGKNLFPGREI